MEFRVLGVSEDASLDDATRALKRIKVACHPDKHIPCSEPLQELLRERVALAEEAYERGRQRLSVDSIVTRMAADHHAAKRAFSTTHRPSAAVHTETYSFSNVNGVVRERGAINGRRMSDEELAARRDAPIALPRLFSHLLL